MGPPSLEGDEQFRMLFTKEEVASNFSLSLAMLEGRFSLKY